MLAKFFVTVLTRNAGVRRLGKAFGVAAVVPLPAEQNHQRERDEAIRIWMGDENEGCEHHCEIPVVDPAIGAASVFHKPSLKRTEKQDADHIAHAVCKSNEYEYSRVDDIGKIESSNDAVKRKPSHSDAEGALPRLETRSVFGRRDKIPRKLLLAARTFEFGGKESARHLDCVNDPYKCEKPMQGLGIFKQHFPSRGFLENINRQYADKHKRANHHFDVMHRGNARDLVVAH